MLSISARGTAATAESYYTHLQDEGGRGVEDYYAAEAAGRWCGMGAMALGLTGAVEREAFRHVLHGRDAAGQDLVRGAGPNHRAGWDLTFSSPKSVSVVWGLADAPLRAAIEAAHDQAVRAALDQLQARAIQARRGHAGQRQESAAMVAALFQHGSSRELDPQLHTHALVMNLAQRADMSWGGIESRHLYAWQKAAGALYRAELAAGLQQLGYQVERAGDAFRLSAVPVDLERSFSKRRAQIEAALARHGTQGARASEVAALNTRRTKQAIDQNQLRADWQLRGLERGWGPAQLAEARQAGPALVHAMPEPAHMLKTLTQHASTFALRDIWREVATAAQGCQDARGIDAYIEGLLHNPELVRLRAASGEIRYSSREMVDLERSMAMAAAQRQHDTRHQVSEASLAHACAARPTLSDEQHHMLQHVCQTTGGVALVEGMAGTGKSFALGAARLAWEAQGLRVRGAALAGKAAQGLEAGSGIPSQTLHSLLAALEVGPREQVAREQLASKDVIVIDEAGMVGSRQMARLLAHVHAAGAKAVLVGDSRQLQPIDAGGAFRALSQRLGAAELTDIRRQRQGWARQAVHDVAEGKAAAALTAYQERGLLAVGADRQDSMRQMVTDWARERDPDRPGESLMLAGTRAEVRQLNELARERMREAHRLGPAAQLEGREFAEGDRVLFTRNSLALGVKNGTLGTLTRVALDHQGEWQFQVRTDTGERVTFSPTRDPAQGGYAHIEHGYAVSVHKAQGATVDRAFVLVSEAMSDREWSYVATSRAREATRIYADALLMAELESSLSRSRQAETTLDYELEPVLELT